MAFILKWQNPKCQLAKGTLQRLSKKTLILSLPDLKKGCYKLKFQDVSIDLTHWRWKNKFVVRKSRNFLLGFTGKRCAKKIDTLI